MTSRLLRRFASWIALLAIVAVTFVPTLTRVASAAGEGADVCSAAFSRFSRNPRPDGDSQHALDDCPYCALHADLALPPNPPRDGARLAVAFRALPVAFLQAPRASAVWAASQPRAPPFLG